MIYKSFIYFSEAFGLQETRLDLLSLNLMTHGELHNCFVYLDYRITVVVFLVMLRTQSVD